jgi:hypothetical protein
MPRLRAAIVVIAAFWMSGCNREPVCSVAPGEEAASTLPDLLKAHDGEVREHGKDICYIKPIGAFGRQGVLASLQHVADRGGDVSSYNNTELVLGVAEEARTKTGYDICKDAPTLSRMSAMAAAANSPSYQRSTHADLMAGLCKGSSEADEEENPSQGNAATAR